MPLPCLLVLLYGWLEPPLSASQRTGASFLPSQPSAGRLLQVRGPGPARGRQTGNQRSTWALWTGCLTVIGKKMQDVFITVHTLLGPCITIVTHNDWLGILWARTQGLRNTRFCTGRAGDPPTSCIASPATGSAPGTGRIPAEGTPSWDRFVIPCNSISSC